MKKVLFLLLFIISTVVSAEIFDISSIYAYSPEEAGIVIIGHDFSVGDSISLGYIGVTTGPDPNGIHTVTFSEANAIRINFSVTGGSYTYTNAHATNDGLRPGDANYQNPYGGVDYFVSNSGDDTNDGTPSSPYEFISWYFFNTTLKYLLQPGDRIFWKRGDTWISTSAAADYGRMRLDNQVRDYPGPHTFGAYSWDGTTLRTDDKAPGARPIFYGYGDAQPTFVADGSNWYWDYAGTNYFGIGEDGVFLQEVATYAQLANGKWWRGDQGSGIKIYFRASDGSNPNSNGKRYTKYSHGSIVSLGGSYELNDFTFENIDLKMCVSGLIIAGSTGTGTFTNLTFRNMDIEGCLSGISGYYSAATVTASDFLIDNVKIHDGGTGIYFANSNTGYSWDNVTIRNSEIYNLDTNCYIRESTKITGDEMALGSQNPNGWIVENTKIYNIGCPNGGNQSSTITNISTTGNPTTITWTDAFIYTSGKLICITGSSTSEDINDCWTITKVDETSGTIPANVTSVTTNGNMLILNGLNVFEWWNNTSSGTCQNNKIRNNLIYDFYYYGIQLCNDLSNNFSGNEITGNIVVGNYTASQNVAWWSPHACIRVGVQNTNNAANKMYNNTAARCQVNYDFGISGVYGWTSRNNLSIDPLTWHEVTDDGMDSDYNVYDDDTGTQFSLDDGATSINFSTASTGFQDLMGADNSQIIDPGFTVIQGDVESVQPSIGNSILDQGISIPEYEKDYFGRYTVGPPEPGALFYIPPVTSPTDRR